MKIKFYNKEHEAAFNSFIERSERFIKTDTYRRALAYLLTLDEVCRKHINGIYDFEKRCIKPECLNSGWQTGTSIKTCMFAFNLYTGHMNWCDPNDRLTASDMFCSEYAPYYCEALKLRYPQYF